MSLVLLSAHLLDLGLMPPASAAPASAAGTLAGD